MDSKRELKERFSTGKKPTGDDFAVLIDDIGASRHREKFVSTENQSVFNLQNSYIPHENQIDVFIEGVSQFSPENYTETSTKSITLAEGLPAGYEVVITYY